MAAFLHRLATLLNKLFITSLIYHIFLKLKNFTRWPVSRVLSSRSFRRVKTAIHLEYGLLRTSRNLPGWLMARSANHPYLVLLLVGFAMPLLLLKARCALTAPFHPYQPLRLRNRLAVSFCCTFPRVTPAGR